MKLKKRSEKTSKKSGKKRDATKVITGKCRSSYMFCRELTMATDKDGNPTGNKTCRSAVLIDKSDKETLKKVRAAIEAAAVKKFGSDVNTKAKKFKNPLRDGDEELEDGDIEGEAFENKFFFNTTGYKLPGVVDEDGERIEDPDELDSIVVSGYYFRFSVTAKGFDNESRGVRFVLNNLMFMEEGERLDGSVSAEKEDWD